MPQFILKSKKKPKFLNDECLSAPKFTKLYHNVINATDLVPRGTSDAEILEMADEKKLKIITKDIRFILNTVKQGKDIIYQSDDGIQVLLKPKIIRTDCNDKKYRCEKTMYLQLFDEVIRP